MVLLLTK